MASTPPSSPSWISFSPDAPQTPTPSKKMHDSSSPSRRSYTRPKAPAYLAPKPSSLPRLRSPPRKCADAVISGVSPEKGSEKDDLGFFASSASVGCDDENSQGFKDSRFSVFLKISTVPTASPTSSDSDSRPSSSSAPSSTLSTPTDLSSAFSTRDEIIEVLAGSFIGAQDAPTENFPFSLPAWCAPSPTSSPTRSLFDPHQPGVDASGAWEDELYTSLPTATPRMPPTPGKSPRHPYYANRPSPRSPVRSRQGSAVSGSRRTSGSLADSPTTSRCDVLASASPVRSTRRPSYATSPRSPTSGIAKKRAARASKKAAHASRKAARKAADQLPITDLYGYQMDALDNFFGVTPMGSKALRCGYSGIGVEDVEGGWKRTAEFRPLLRDEDGDDQLASPEPAQGSFGIAYDDSSDSEPTTKKRRPPPLDLSRSRSRSVSLASNASDGDIMSGRTISSPGPHILSPDPLSKEIRRRASEAALRTAKVSDGNSGQKTLKTKKSMGKILKAAWSSLVDGGAEEKAQKQAAGAGDFF